MQRQYTLAFLIAGLLGGVAAVAYAPTFQMTPYMADEVLLSAFVVVVLGGLGSVWGAVLGGLALGVVESLGSAYISSSYQSAFGSSCWLSFSSRVQAGSLTANARRVGMKPAGARGVRHAAAAVGIVAIGFVGYHFLTTLKGDRGQVCILVMLWTVSAPSVSTSCRDSAATRAWLRHRSTEGAPTSRRCCCSTVTGRSSHRSSVSC